MTISQELHDAISELIVLDGMVDTTKLNPNADEAWLLYNNAGAKTLAAVQKLLEKLKVAIGKPG